MVDWSISFWDVIIASSMPQTQKDFVRWDIFEDNFIVFLLENVNIMHELLERISWK